MVNYEVIEGTPGLAVDDVAHVMIPGRGRDMAGRGLSSYSLQRVAYAAEFYKKQGLQQKGGIIVCCGYKTPSDHNGEPWSPEDHPDKVYEGVPEGYAMKAKLIELGIPKSVIRVEPQSFDTVTNFTNAEAGNYFIDDQPIAIVATRQHLERIMEIVAPKTLKRSYLGVVVPEKGSVDTDSLKSKVLSEVILLGVNPETPNLAAKADLRAKVVWRVTNPPAILKGSKPYKTDSPGNNKK